MLRIDCPFCGQRDYTEFRYGGDAVKPRPVHGTADSKVWHDYVFLFDNPKGPHREYWQHVLGCRQWLVLDRDTATNTVRASHKPGRAGKMVEAGEAGGEASRAGGATREAGGATDGAGEAVPK